jgi:hypothetical protein
MAYTGNVKGRFTRNRQVAGVDNLPARRAVAMAALPG